MDMIVVILTAQVADLLTAAAVVCRCQLTNNTRALTPLVASLIVHRVTLMFCMTRLYSSTGVPLLDKLLDRVPE